ncbi:MAG: methyltransferase [Chitinophagaceae bacterium]|nr:methyltransferase [Chitinophagaceae bacterium]MCB9046951.1 methyltransferase [Chitinophagales bacterium]
MSNSYFRFKQFTVHQEKCAMKVSTDACIQGAWTDIPAGCDRVLDIGTGTGLLALMMAHKADVLVDALEIDEAACLQARENVAMSDRADKVRVLHVNARAYRGVTKYDLIITNPPFFNNSLLGETPQRNTARHTVTLSYTELFITIKENITDHGLVSILLPVDEFTRWQKLLDENNWQVIRKLNVHPSVGRSANRIVAMCSAGVGRQTITEELYIRKEGNVYTQEFCKLMSPHYLNI